MVIITYERVEHWVSKTVPCRFCGKKIKRSTTLGQTLSPFNKDTDGNLKTERQIRAELNAKAKTWHPHNDIHAKCIEAEQAAKVGA